MIDGQGHRDPVSPPSPDPAHESAVAMLREEIWRRERWMVAAGEITTALLAGDASELVLPMIASRARELAGADCALLLVPEPGSGQSSLVVAAVSAVEPLQAEPLLGTLVPISGSVSGMVFHDGTSRQVDDLSQVSPPATVVGVELGPAVVVPLANKGDTLGALMVARTVGGEPFSDEVAAVTESFARQAALALHLAESQRTERRLARLEDRERIAVDLQDNLIQRLFAIGMLMESVGRRLGSSILRDKLDQAAHELDATIKQTRETIHSLHALADPDRSELRQRLRAAIDEASASTTVSPSVYLDGPLDALVPAEIADSAVAMVRDAVADMLRNGATAVTVTVAASDTLAVTVADDVAADPSSDLLLGLSDQAAVLGGELTLATDPAAGRRLIWQVPLY